MGSVQMNYFYLLIANRNKVVNCEIYTGGHALKIISIKCSLYRYLHM